MKTVAITAEVAGVLAAATCDGQRLVLGGQLSRDLYERTNKVLCALGAKWNKRERAHLFPGDAGAAIREALGAGEAVDLKKSWEQFYTPAELAERMAAVARIREGDWILEPSCGTGNLLAAIDVPIAGVTAVDIDDRAIEHTRQRFLPRAADVVPAANMPLTSPSIAAPSRRQPGAPRWVFWAGDFLMLPTPDHRLVDVVLMNPPFSNGQDVQHVTRAWKWLARGGRLVAVMSPHWTFAGDRRSLAFREWIETIGATVDDIAPGVFAESGTNVGAKLVTATKA